MDNKYIEFPTEFYRHIEELGSKIANAMGPKVDYSASLDLDLLPEIIVMSFSNRQRTKWLEENEVSESDLIEDIHFLARGNVILPRKLVDANLWYLKSYITKHKEKLFDKIEQVYNTYLADVLE